MNGQQTPPFSLETFSGRGLADARALWAAIVGPHRLAIARSKSIELRQDAGGEIYKNIGAADGYVLVGVALPISAPTNPLNVIFGDSDQLGINASAPFVLNSQMGGGGFGPTGFMQLLLPGEQLYAQIVDTSITSGATQRVVVAAVTL